MALLVAAIPSQPVFARRQRTRPHLAHKLSQEVVDGYIYSLGTVGHRQGDSRGRIKRIGIVRTQDKLRRRGRLNGDGCGQTVLVDKDKSPARNISIERSTFLIPPQHDQIGGSIAVEVAGEHLVAHALRARQPIAAFENGHAIALAEQDDQGRPCFQVAIDQGHVRQTIAVEVADQGPTLHVYLRAEQRVACHRARGVQTPQCQAVVSIYVRGDG